MKYLYCPYQEQWKALYVCRHCRLEKCSAYRAVVRYDRDNERMARLLSLAGRERNAG